MRWHLQELEAWIGHKVALQRFCVLLAERAVHRIDGPARLAFAVAFAFVAARSYLHSGCSRDMRLHLLEEEVGTSTLTSRSMFRMGRYGWIERQRQREARENWAIGGKNSGI